MMSVASCLWCSACSLKTIGSLSQPPYTDGHPFAALRTITPDHRAAFSILLYDMRRPEVAAVLERAWAAGTP